MTLAEAGFTASGTIFDEGDWLENLGETFHVTGSYLKPYPSCRWAQPGIDAALDLVAEHAIDPETVETVVVHTFEEATHLRTRSPDSVEAAEYSYPYPVAAAIVEGRFTTAELDETARTDPLIARIADRVRLTTDDDVDSQFPEACLARVTIDTTDGTYRSPVTAPRGSTARPLSEAERVAKAYGLLEPTVGESAVETVTAAFDRPDAGVDRLLDPWTAT